MTRLIKNLSEPKLLLTLGVGYTCLATIALLSPTGDFPKIHFPFGDKAVHVLIHILLSFLWLLYAFFRRNEKLDISTFMIVIGLCLGYGIVIEVFQEVFTTSRQADWQDVIANIIGSGLGVFLFWKVKATLNTKT